MIRAIQPGVSFKGTVTFDPASKDVITQYLINTPRGQELTEKAIKNLGELLGEKDGILSAEAKKGIIPKLNLVLKTTDDTVKAESSIPASKPNPKANPNNPLASDYVRGAFNILTGNLKKALANPKAKESANDFFEKHCNHTTTSELP